MEEEVRCPVCNAEEVSVFQNRKTPENFGFSTAEGYRIYSCKGCDCQFAWPREELKYDNIQGEFDIYRRFLDVEEFKGRIHHVLRGTAHWKDSPIVYQILKLHEKRGNFFDFGAGSGYMTELARRLGYSVNALEVSEHFRRFIKHNIPGVKVFSSLDEVQKEDRCFDVILAMHTIEHLAEPVATLKRLADILSNDGLLIVVVPNLKRTYYRLGEQGSEIEDQIQWDGVPGDFPPHHLTRFSKKAMVEALKRAGFRNIAINYALLNAWDLFHHGLGDESFAFKRYFTNTARMRYIAEFECNLNRLMERLGLEDLGNTMIALASKSITPDALSELLTQARNRVMEVYLNSCIEDHQKTEQETDSLREAIKKKDEYIQSLRETLTQKDEELARLEALRHTLEDLLQDRTKTLEKLYEYLSVKLRE